MNVKKDATQPRPRAYLEAPPGTPLDLSEATEVRFVMVDNATGAVKVDAAASIVDAPSGLVEYAWGAGNTDTIGLYRVEWRVTMSGGDFWKVPSNGSAFVNVLPSP